VEAFRWCGLVHDRILSIRNRDHFWKAVAPSRPLLGAMALTGVLALALPYVPPVARLFSFSAPPLSEVGVVLLMTVLYVLALDVVKVRYKLVENPRSPRWLSQRIPVAAAPALVPRTTAGAHK